MSAVLFLAPFCAGLPISAEAQEVSVSSNPRQYVVDIGAGAQYKPKYPGSDEYILVPLPLVALQRLFIPGFGQVVDGEEELRAFYMFPSFDFNGKREASDARELTGMRLWIGHWNLAWALDTATTGYEEPSKLDRVSTATKARS
jgi:hypothetical protein